MPEKTFVVNKKTKCPVCKGKAKKRYYNWISGTCKRIEIWCEDNICQYSYGCEGLKGTEVIGFIVISWDICCGDDPKLKKTKERISKVITARDAALDETRRLLAERDVQLIFSCFQSPNANREVLADRLYLWVEKNSDGFPITYTALKVRKEYHEDKQDDRQSGENDFDSNDNFEGSPGGG